MRYSKMMPEGRRLGPPKLAPEFDKVSSRKPVGYEKLGFLVNRCGLDPAQVQKDLDDSGLRTLMLTGEECVMRSGALYAYDEKALVSLLHDRAPVLSAHRWPGEPENFIRRLAVDWAPEKTLLFDMIADAFNNTSHPGRTDVEIPAAADEWHPAYLSMLRGMERPGL